MANYTIIGGDGKQYGPITGEDLRKWISEGRLNAQSLAKADSDAEFRTLATFPELTDAFAPQAAALDAPPSLSNSADWLERDYELDIGDCISRSWKLFKENMGTLFGAFFVSMLLAVIGVSIINAVLLFLVPKTILASPVLRQFFNVPLQAGAALVMSPFLGGLYYVFIQRMRGRPAAVGDIFVGFKKMFSQLFLGNFVVSFFTGLCLIPFNIVYAAKVAPITERLQQSSSVDIQNMPLLWPALFGTLPILLVCMIPVTYLTVNWLFTLPLIIDKQMKFWPAMKASWKKAHQHWWLLLGLTVVVGLLNLAGACACCVGALFTLPIGTAAMMFAYETIFGESQTR
jgi:Membrane domain of glycerophosphoryl diester phosphodiesterase/GYF domain 2